MHRERSLSWKLSFATLAASACLFSPLMARSQSPPPPGELDSTFNPQANDTVYAVAVQQPGNKILVGGNFTRINNLSRNYLARLNADGSVDDSFFSVSGADNSVRALVVQADGRILVGGDFGSIHGMNWSRVARLNADGSIDSSFDQLIGANSRVLAITPYEDQVVIGGNFTKVNGVTRSYLARLNSNGSLDASFNPSFNGTVYAVVVLPDKKLLVGGDFTYVNNAAAKYLARLLPNGAVDSSFSVGADYTVHAVGLQSNGKVILGGLFGRLNNTSHNGIARLNTDGMVDELFTAGTSGTVYALAIQADDKIIAGGRFGNFNNANRVNIARLNANGLLDASFDPVQGPSYTINSLALQSDGKIVLGGDFMTVNAIDHNYLARLNGNPPPAKGEEGKLQIATAVEITWRSDSNATYQVQWAFESNTNAWHNFGSPIPGNGSTNAVFDSTRGSARKFYRLIKL